MQPSISSSRFASLGRTSRSWELRGVGFLAGGQGGWVSTGSLGQEGSQADLLEHIQVIVRGWAIRANADIQASFEHLMHGCKS